MKNFLVYHLGMERCFRLWPNDLHHMFLCILKCCCFSDGNGIVSTFPKCSFMFALWITFSALESHTVEPRTIFSFSFHRFLTHKRWRLFAESSPKSFELYRNTNLCGFFYLLNFDEGAQIFAEHFIACRRLRRRHSAFVLYRKHVYTRCRVQSLNENHISIRV